MPSERALRQKRRLGQRTPVVLYNFPLLVNKPVLVGGGLWKISPIHGSFSVSNVCHKFCLWSPLKPTILKKKKRSNYLNQSAIECTFQWLVLRLLSQQCFPRAKKPKGACAWLLKPRSQLRGKFACRNWVAGNTQDIILQACSDITIPCNRPGWQWEWQPDSSVLLASGSWIETS